MTDDAAGFRERMLDLARQAAAAPDDAAALALMRDATGLTFTDPEADRRELDRRVRAAHRTCTAPNPPCHECRDGHA